MYSNNIVINKEFLTFGMYIHKDKSLVWATIKS